MANPIFKAIGEVASLLNKLTGNYQARVKDGLITTADNLVEVIISKSIKKERKPRLIRHYCKQWRANRKKLR